jgi:hypothetical protein
MSPIRSSLLLGAGDAAPTGAQISRSLRFNAADSAYLSRTPASAGNRRTWTWSGWVKRSVLDSATFDTFFACRIDGGNYTGLIGYRNSPNDIGLVDYSGGASRISVVTTQVFRDTSAWFHLLCAVDTTAATSTDRVKIYVNGVLVTALSSSTYPSQNIDTSINTANSHRIGEYAGYYSNSYLANVQLIDGQALTPASFAETDATTGQWIPKAYSGSYGTNGFYLQFADNSSNTASTLGKDYSGLGNNWTPNNLSVTAGAGNDSLVDSPTNYGTDTGVGGEVRGNYCTWNAVNKSANTTLSNGNLNATSTVGDWRAVFGTVGMSSGKWYWELTITGASYHLHGIAKQGANLDAFIGTDANGWGYYGSSGTYNNSNYINTSTFASYTTNDVIGVAFDADNGSLYFYKNGTVQNSGSPAYTGLTSGPYFPAVSHFSSTNSDANFGQRAFAYQTPGTNRPAATFLALCTQNLPAPLVTKSNTVMDVVLYTGNNSTQSITSLAFNPDMVWSKCRNVGRSHRLSDAIRGSNVDLYTDTTASDNFYGSGSITAFTANGFNLDNSASSQYNTSGETYVSWCWDAGTSTVSNTQGGITSQVRANASAGFSVISYTGNGSGGSTIGHGLGVAPAFAIFKNRSTSSDWQVYHVSLGNANSILLQSTAAAGSSSAFNSTSPTSTVITLGAGTSLNNNGSNHICYAWTPVVGYSAMGSYVGSGTSDGPFVYTGFRPRFVLAKRTDNTGDWFIWDAARVPYNQNASILWANSSNAETTSSSYGIDLLSNGFKLTGGSSNSNFGTLVYAAFAEAPFNYSRAR